MFYFSVVLNLVIFSIISYALYKFINKEFRIGFLLIILKYVLPLMSSFFFLPMFFILLSAFDCTKNDLGQKTSLYSDDLKCYTTLFYFNCIISSISLVLFVPISLLTVTIYYEYSLDGQKKVLSKTTSIPDVFFLISKMFITGIFVGLDGGIEIHYILISTLILFSSLTLYLNFTYERYNEKLLNFIHKYLSLTFFWASICLLIGRFTLNSEFNSCLGLFITIEPILCIILFYRKNHLKDFLYVLGKEESLKQTLNHIQSFLYLLTNKKEERESELILNSYIEIYESSCILKDCPLKRYLALIKNKMEGNGCLLQHADFLFNCSINKFPDSVELKFAYSLFLLKKLKRRKRAAEFLSSIKTMSPSIEEEFIIFRCNRLFEDNLSDLQDEDNENVDMVKELRFRNYYKNFIDLIEEASYLYITFWNHLLESYNTENENVNKLNNCGSKINRIIKEIDYLINEMKKIKSNHITFVKIYYEFLYKILGDKKKCLQYKNLITEIDDELHNKKLPEFRNININILNKNDYYQYIVVSAVPEKFGIITNASLGISEIFGYELKNLIGHNLDMLIPDNFQEEHNKLLKKKIKDFKKNVYDQANKNNYEVKEVNSFGKTKSKYLIELSMKVILYQSEYNEQFFIGSISRDSSFYHTNNDHNKKQTCYILTDNHLIIKNFTPNSSIILGITSDMMNNNIEITYYIRDIYEQFLKLAIEMGQLTPEQKLNLKKKIIIKNYSNPNLINWKKSDLMESLYVSTRIVDIIKRNNSKIIPNNNNNSVQELTFYLTVIEQIINNKITGYLFKLEKPLNDDIYSKNLKNSEIKLKIANKNLTSAVLRSNVDSSPKKSNLIVPPDFVPTSNTNLKLDVQTFNYKLSKQLNKNTLTDFVKSKYLSKIEKEKLKLINEKEEEEEEEEEDDEEEFEELEEYEEEKEVTEENNKLKNSRIQFLNQKKIMEKSPAIKSIKNNPIEPKTNTEYYNVNFKKIKLYEYDFNKNAIYEKEDYEKISQVEKRINDYPKKNNENKEKQRLEKEKELKEIKKSKIEIKINLGFDVNEEDDNDFIIEQIDAALKKEENQETIVILQLNSIICFLLLILMTVVSMLFLKKGIKTIRKCSNLVLNSGDLMGYNGEVIFYIRELTLLYNENYTLFPSKYNRDDYIESVIDTLLLLFEKIDNMIAYNIAVDINFSDKTKYEIAERLYNISNIKNDFSILYTSNNLNSILIELSMDIFNICNKLLIEVISTDPDIFHFLRNSLNQVGEALYTQISVYIKEMDIQANKIKVISIIGFVCIILFIGCIYYLISKAYYAVAEKKEKYIEIFFDINIDIILTSLEKCENYYKKIKGEMEIEYDESEQNEQITNNIQLHKQQSQKQKDRNLKRNLRAKALSKIVLTKILLFLILLGIYYLIVFIMYIKFLQNSYIYIKYYENECVCENEYHLIFNSLREAFFDKNSLVFNLKADEYILKELDVIYIKRRKANEYMNLYRKGLPQNFFRHFTEILNMEACDLKLDDYFESDDECYSFMNNATKYGLDLTASYFIEEIRFADHIRRYYHSTVENINNLTLMGTEQYINNWPTDPNELEKFSIRDPINIFNSDLLNDLSIFYRNFMIPLYTGLRVINIDTIQENLNETNNLYSLLFIVYISIFSFIFFFYWIPFVNNLNVVLYKTKNLLSIIPKEVLMNINGIYSLFGLEEMDLNNNEK